MLQRAAELPVSAPLKTALTGVELLLARAQLWEESAAKHVSMAPQLASLAGLATRWRRLELASWRCLLVKTAERHAAGLNAPRSALEGWASCVPLLLLNVCLQKLVLAVRQGLDPASVRHCSTHQIRHLMTACHWWLQAPTTAGSTFTGRCCCGMLPYWTSLLPQLFSNICRQQH